MAWSPVGTGASCTRSKTGPEPGGRTNHSRALVEAALARIADPTGEGSRVFIKVRAERARAAADAMDAARKVGLSVGRYAGIPIALKDLFTLPGSRLRPGRRCWPTRRRRPRTHRRATNVDAGFIAMGRVNMTNSPSPDWASTRITAPDLALDRGAARIPGGSSSGTRCRRGRHGGRRIGHRHRRFMPRSGCVLRGRRLQADRAPGSDHRSVTLAPSLDSVGPRPPPWLVAPRSTPSWRANHRSFRSPRLWPDYASRCRRTWCWTGWTRLSPPRSTARCRCCRVPAPTSPRPLPVFRSRRRGQRQRRLRGERGLCLARALLAAKGPGYDPRIRVRIMRGEGFSAADYLDLAPARARIVAEFDTATRDFDCVVMPTVPIVAPRIVDLDDERDYNRSTCSFCATRHWAIFSIVARSAFRAISRATRRSD